MATENESYPTIKLGNHSYFISLNKYGTTVAHIELIGKLIEEFIQEHPDLKVISTPQIIAQQSAYILDPAFVWGIYIFVEPQK